MKEYFDIKVQFINLTIPYSTSQAVMNFDIKVQFMNLTSCYSTFQAVLNVNAKHPYV